MRVPGEARSRSSTSRTTRLHKILNEWADIVPAHFDVYPLIDAQAANRALAAQLAGKT
jgi:hypothetical protein